MTKYKIGDVADFDGVKRKVIGFSVINGEPYPNTEPFVEPEEPEEETPEPETEDPATDPATEPEKESDAPVTLKCRYCGKEYKDASWLEAHEVKCKENPANMKGGEE